MNSAENLVAEVAGDIEEVDDVLRITRIRLQYRMVVPIGKTETVERVLTSYAEKCPAYQSVKECIDCTWEAEITEQ